MYVVPWGSGEASIQSARRGACKQQSLFMVMVAVFPLRQEVGGDRPRRTHGHDTACARGRIASAPAGEDGAGGRSGGQSNGGPAGIIRGTARRARPADNPGRTGGDGAATGARLVDREDEALQVKGGGNRPRRTHGHGTGRARDRIAAAPADERGPSGGRGRSGDHRATIVGG